MCVSASPACQGTGGIPEAYGGQKIALEALGLKLQTAALWTSRAAVLWVTFAAPEVDSSEKTKEVAYS